MPGTELITLFGNELPEVESARVGVRVASGQKVSARDMARMLLAMSIAELLAQGTATLSQIEVRKLLRNKQVLTLTSAGGGDGFAGLVSRASRNGRPVGDLCLAILGQRVSSPETVLIGMGKALLAPTGAVVAASGAGRRLGALVGVSGFDIDEGKAEALRGDWERVKAGWQSWKAANAGQAHEIGEACRSSLTQAREIT